MTEVFINIKKSPNYQISNLGRVLRKPHTTIGPSGEKRFWKEKWMTIRIEKNNGYVSTALKGKIMRIHRLIAEHFIPNPENKKEVNHINGDRADFRIENLEWVTRTENQRHSFQVLKRKGGLAGKTGFLNARGTLVNKCTLDGQIIEAYGSMRDASIKNGYHSYAVEWSIKKKDGFYKGNYWCYGG